jgi:hypothetical protein
MMVEEQEITRVRQDKRCRENESVWLVRKMREAKGDEKKNVLLKQ